MSVHENTYLPTLDGPAVYLLALGSPLHHSPTLSYSLGLVSATYVSFSQELPFELGQWEIVVNAGWEDGTA